MEEELRTTHNFDVAGLCQRINRFIYEALKCQSANTASVNEHDFRRLSDYLGACVTYKNWITGNPQLDMPEVHPTNLEVRCPSLPAIDSVENESIKDWARHMWVACMELVNSQSSRASSGLNPHDVKRFEDIMAKLKAFLDGYVSETLPLDLPESIPLTAGVTSGRTGI